METQSMSQVAVVMVPLPAQGHLNPALHLSHLIVSYGVPVHYAGSATHNNQVKLRVQGWDTRSLNNIHFHDFQLPPYTSPPPNLDPSVPFPTHLQPLFDVSTHLRQPVSEQEKGSVIYISFGSTTSLRDDQIRELATGLERSGQKFIWVLRNADEGETEVRSPQLPEGYEERVKDRGMVVRDWAPQLEILAHPSTGGFMSHCGWNSCIESISMGVPFAAWPMHSDQPRNAVLITEVLKVGVVVRYWEDRAKLVTSSHIENAVKRLMTSKEGEDIQRRASALGEALRQSASKGGASSSEMDSFITYITR